MALVNYGDFSTNSSNPYYLHPNKNLALTLISPPLDNKNYHSWARSIHITLISKNKEKFVDGTLPKPDVSDPLYVHWIRCNTMVLARIHSCIDESISKSVLWTESAIDVWLNLKTHFSQSDIFWISDIQEGFYKLHQENLDISDYLTKMMVLWDELETYHLNSNSKFSIQSSCNVIASL